MGNYGLDSNSFFGGINWSQPPQPDLPTVSVSFGEGPYRNIWQVMDPITARKLAAGLYNAQSYMEPGIGSMLGVGANTLGGLLKLFGSMGSTTGTTEDPTGGGWLTNLGNTGGWLGNMGSIGSFTGGNAITGEPLLIGSVW